MRAKAVLVPDTNENDDCLVDFRDSELPASTKVRLLFVSMTRRAIVDYILYRKEQDARLRKMGIDAEKWLFGENNNPHLFSFSTSCCVLELDIDAVREFVKGLGPDDVLRMKGLLFDASD